MGADRKLARWDKLVEYYDLLASMSPRLLPQRLVRVLLTVTLGLTGHGLEPTRAL